jgi:hypothetical protein
MLVSWRLKNAEQQIYTHDVSPAALTSDRIPASRVASTTLASLHRSVEAI